MISDKRKTTKKKMNKKYIAPELTIIELDIEISLAMESFPDGHPTEGEGAYLQPQQMQNDPYKIS